MTEVKKKFPPSTIWSKTEVELIPHRFRMFLIGVLPITYAIMFLFGVSSIFFPLQTFVTVVGMNSGYYWAGLIGLLAGISLISLIFKKRLELYSALLLTLALAIYPGYALLVVFADPVHGGLPALRTFFAALTYPIIPGWRVIDIALEIRKSRRRQLYAESVKGGPNVS
jgi:hypothetical protein